MLVTKPATAEGHPGPIRKAAVMTIGQCTRYKLKEIVPIKTAALWESISLTLGNVRTATINNDIPKTLIIAKKGDAGMPKNADCEY